MPSEKGKILAINQHIKLDKMPYIIYTDMEFLIKQVDGCASSPENSSTTKIGEHIPCGYSISTIWAFDHISHRKQTYFISWKRLYENVLYFFRRTREKYSSI